VPAILPKIIVLQNKWLPFTRFIISFHWNDKWKSMVKKAVPSFLRTWSPIKILYEINFCWWRTLIFFLRAWNNAWPVVNSEIKTFKYSQSYPKPQNRCHLQPAFYLVVIWLDIPLNELWCAIVRYTHLVLGEGGICNLLSWTRRFHALDLLLSSVVTRVPHRIGK
jgi:hypothetical protein